MREKYLSLDQKTRRNIKVSVWIMFILTFAIFSGTMDDESLEGINTILSAIILTALVFGILFQVWEKKKHNQEMDEIRQKTNKVEYKIDYKDYLPAFIDDYYLKWSYTQKLAFPSNFDTIKEGLSEGLNLDHEADNIHDADAVAVFSGEVKLGYLYKGNVKDMVHKYFFNREDFTPAMIVTEVNEETQTIRVLIAFYKQIDIENNPNVKILKSRISNNYDPDNRDDRYYALDDIEIGEKLSIEDDGYYGCLVYTEQGDELGRIGKKAAEEVEDFLADELGQVIGKVTNIKELEDDKRKVDINIYLISKRA